MTAADRAWALTRALSSHRPSVRVAVRDASGAFTNEYTAVHQLRHGAPDGPWAMYLAADGGYRYLCFDLDAKGGNPARDAQRLTRWLDEAGIAHLVCVSGPSGGRHVWVAMTKPADPDQVKTLARRAKTLLPSLDLSPFNPTHGAVRPPYAPHRGGGVSEPQGPVDVLLSPSTTPAQLAALDAMLADEGAALPAPATALQHGMARDDAGRPYLTGSRRELSRTMRQLVDEPPAAHDASYTMHQVLVAAANARWRYDDVLRLAQSAPALEHARTRRHAVGRKPRTPGDTARVIAAAWENAVRFAAANPTGGRGDDPDFEDRQNRTLAALTRLQERADAQPGLWGADRSSRAHRASRGSAAQRAVLDALSLYMAQAARLDVEADVRRLALDTGYGRTSVHNALAALSRPTVDGDPESAWIVRTADAEGIHGATYRPSRRFSTEADDRDWTQALAPPGTGTLLRNEMIRELGSRLTRFAHDVFCAPGSLGRSAGILHAHLPEGASATVAELSPVTGMPARTVRRMLRRLHRFGLVELDAGRWKTTDVDRDQVAQTLGVAGYLEARRLRYELERERWAWWQAELNWMHKPGKARRRRADPTAVALVGRDRPATNRYPRGPDRRGDHRAALTIVASRRTPPTMSNDVWGAEKMLTELLGAVRVS